MVEPARDRRDRAGVPAAQGQGVCAAVGCAAGHPHDVRFNAKAWGIDPARIGIIGFSAGGHLASTAGTHFDAGDPKATDPVNRVSCRPDFAILIYPVVTMGEKGHGGSKANLLGRDPKPEMVDLFSNEKQVTDKTPPMFLAHAKDDTVVAPDNSRMLYEALKAHKVPAEYLELPSGGHGLNGYKGPMWDAWQTKSLEWLERLERPALPVLERTSGGAIFRWDLATDRAELRLPQATKPFWQGPLLPSFWLKGPAGDRQFIKAKAVGITPARTIITPKRSASEDLSLTLRLGVDQGTTQGEVALSLEGMGHGFLRWEAAEAGIIFRHLEVQWDGRPPELVAMYFGMAPLSAEEQVMVPTLERPFWPRWQADGYCVPSAKGSPIQSFFRCWDFGHANIPLGSFGPAMGTPYAAAYPRPLFSAAMGSDEGWVAMGPGTVPDAALTLQIRSSTAALEWLYREDLWPAPAQGSRVWSEPLRLFWAPVAWEAYAAAV